MKFGCAIWLLLLSLVIYVGCQSQTDDAKVSDKANLDSSSTTSGTGTDPGDGVGSGSDSKESQTDLGENQTSNGAQQPEIGGNRVATLGEPTSLFNGKSLDGWKVTEFGAESVCRVDDGKMIIEMGYPMNGLTSVAKDLPKINYEFSLEAKRVDGIDFFCGVTFPYKESHCSLIVGGWAGSTVGLSCVDGKDASDNETKKMMSFDDDRWYRVRIRAVDDNISCWIDEEKIVDLDTEGRDISLRNDSAPTRPLSIYTFQTTAAYRNLQLRKVNPATVTVGNQEYEANSKSKAVEGSSGKSR